MVCWRSRWLLALLWLMLAVGCEGAPRLALAPREAAPGAVVEVTLTNLSGLTAQVWVGGRAAELADEPTAQRLRFIVPYDIPPGPQPVVVIGGERLARATLVVLAPSVILSQEWAFVGDPLTLRVSGLALEALTLTIGGQTVPLELSATAARFTVPKLPAGRQTLRLEAPGFALELPLRVLDAALRQATHATLLLAPGVDLAELERELAQLGLALSRAAPLGAPAGPCSGALAEVAVGELGLIAALERLRELERMLPEAVLHIDPRSNWSIGAADYRSAIGVPLVHQRGLTGAGSLIAVLDTGVSPHPELGERLRADLGFVAVEGASSVDDDFDDANLPNPPEIITPEQDGHGTPVAVLAAGATLGVAPGAEVMPVKVCDARGICLSSDVILGVCHALSVAARPEIGPKRLILNLSLGGNMPIEALAAILEAALAQGVVVVAAGGNQGELNDPLLREYPAAFNLPGLLAVAALAPACPEASTTRAEAPAHCAAPSDWRPADFSTRGDYLDLAAPGQGLWVSTPEGAWLSYEGTSFATPLVAGALALWKEVYPELTPAQLAANLKASAQALFEGPKPYPAHAVGAGMLDLSVYP